MTILIIWLAILTFSFITVSYTFYRLRKNCQQQICDKITYENNKVNAVRQDLKVLEKLTKSLTSPMSETQVHKAIRDIDNGRGRKK